MRYLTIYTPAAAPSGPPDGAHMAKMGALMERFAAAGVLVAAGGLGKSETSGLNISLHDGALTVTEGPFTDLFSKAAGFAILDAPSKDDLIGYVRDFLEAAGDGQNQVLQIVDPPNAA